MRPFAGVLLIVLPMLAGAEPTLNIQRLQNNSLVFTVEDLPREGAVFHLRQSTDGVHFEPLSPALEIWNTNRQPYSIPVDPTSDSTLFIQVYQGASPEPFMEMVPVGNPGNADDPEDGDRDTEGGQHFGAVAYEYRIGKYEVTNAQYAAFLNAVAVVDPNNLYKTGMGSDGRGGISRSGESGSYTYTVKANMDDKPVIWVNWYDTARFCNWLHNDQPAGQQEEATTENGAYTLTGKNSVKLPGTDPTHGTNGRNAGARFWLPSEHEWYKAAYHQPAAQGGDADHYWLYPTRSNFEPTVATADEFGNIVNDTRNIANYARGAIWNGQDGNITTVGSGGPGSENFYGAFDMGGNLWEWNEQIIGGARGLRGGAWLDNASNLQSTIRSISNPPFGNINLGFRVAGF